MVLEDIVVLMMIKMRGILVNCRLWDLCVINNKLCL